MDAFAAEVSAAYTCGVRVPFIPPALPKLRASPPTGEGWLYELKFDGYRVQLHKAGLSSAIYGRNGGDFSRRFPRIAAAVLGLPTKSCIIDGELIAAGRHASPISLPFCTGGMCERACTASICWNWTAAISGNNRSFSVARLEALLKRAKCNVIRFSETFPNANDLLAECARRGLEGIVAKRKDAPYRSGTRSGWIKVKTAEWRAANQYRVKLFEKSTPD
jgi:bifunctional non-homologous end joining protein LigD